MSNFELYTVTSVLQLCSSSAASRPSLEDEEDLVAAGLVLEQTDFDVALDKLQSAHSDTIGAPKVSWFVTW